MSGWDDDDARRDGIRHAQSEVGRHRSRKNTRRWCRGKVGVQHVLDVRLSKHTTYIRDRFGSERFCYPPPWGITDYWWCSHERYCVNCGKIIDVTLGRDCPDYVHQESDDTTQRKSP